MTAPLPAELLEADQALHELFQRVAFSRYLNPLNVPEARKAFLEGKEAPPFAYLRADWAEDADEMLRGLSLPMSHPFGVLFSEAVLGTRLLIAALHYRTEEAFLELMEHHKWRPDSALLDQASHQVQKSDPTPFVLTAKQLQDALRTALDKRGMKTWSVTLDPIMAARVLVDSAKQTLRVNSRAHFRRRDVDKLVAHEIDVHAVRGSNGQSQPLKLFATGLPSSLETEEGLALYAEECVGASSPGNAWRQGLVVQAVAWAEHMGFRALYERISEIGGPSLAWSICLRVKRGLSSPSEAGVYGKDVVYFRGLRTVRKYLETGGSIENLFVGKVGVHHPVNEWLHAGLILPGRVPDLFSIQRRSA